MQEVDVGGETFSVYADLDTANTYMAGAIHGTTWRDAEDDDKSRALVTATRILDRQTWLGTKSEDDQALAFPRDDMGLDPEPVLDDYDVPVDIVNAAAELALSLLDGSEVQNQQTTEELVRSMSAGSVSITNFRGVNQPVRFPQIVQELVKRYLGSVGLASDFGAKASGVDTETVFPVEAGFNTGGI